MNILYIHRTQGKGVEGIHIRSIVKALRELNHKVTVFSPPGCDPFMTEEGRGDNQSIKKKILSFISRNSPEIFFECLELLYNVSSFAKLKRMISAGNVDLIYERYFLFSLTSSILARKNNIPIIYEVNDSSFVPRLRKLKPVRLANYLERKVFLAADAIITVSNYLKDLLIKAGIPGDKIIVTHNAVDPRIFDPGNVKKVALDIPSDRIVLGFVGLFVKWVGLDEFLRLYHKIFIKYPQTHLLLVGSGPEESRLRKIIDDLGLQSHVTITGTVPHSQVPSYIERMDFCIIPKHEKYTSPVKLFEYMAMGKAILVPAYESIKEVVRDGENGMLFEPDDESHLFIRLQELVENKELLRFLGKNARQEILEKHTWHNNARQIEDIASRLKQKNPE